MDKELALRTFGYLIGHYKTHNETTINKQEIEAIEFILKDNEFLEQQVKKQKEVIDKIRKLIEKHYYKESDDYYDYFTEGVCLQDEDYNELEDILKEVE